MFREMFDGLRDFYARRDKSGADPSFSAAMCLAFMFGVNAVSALTLVAAWLLRDLTVVEWFPAHKLGAIAIGVVVAWVHVALAKRERLYGRKGPPLLATWSRGFIGYCAFTGLMFGAAVLSALLMRQD